MAYEFRWNDWNVEHIAKHGIGPEEAEYVVNNARRPYPEKVGDRKYLAMGQTLSGDYIQVVFIVEPSDVLFVIHARPLRDHEKRQFRRRRQT